MTNDSIAAARPPITSAPQLMDGGFVTAPDAAVYGLEGQWEVENSGVAPDIEVEFEPAAWRHGRDPQLEKAVEVLFGRLGEEPSSTIQEADLPELSQRKAVKK